MEEALTLIEKTIEEHKAILQRFQAMERVTNDAEAINSLEKAKDAFMPGRFDQKGIPAELGELVNSVDEGLQAHFDREETALLNAFENYGDRELASAFHSLLLEHEGLRERLTQSKDHLAKLTSGELSRHQWEATGYDMRAHISQTRKLLEAHAAGEKELLLQLRDRLAGESRETTLA